MLEGAWIVPSKNGSSPSLFVALKFLLAAFSRLHETDLVGSYQQRAAPALPGWAGTGDQHTGVPSVLCNDIIEDFGAYFLCIHEIEYQAIFTHRILFTDEIRVWCRENLR